eukprot:2356527-Pyramimonas_sp.AAC.1
MFAWSCVWEPSESRRGDDAAGKTGEPLQRADRVGGFVFQGPPVGGHAAGLGPCSRAPPPQARKRCAGGRGRSGQQRPGRSLEL